MVAKICQPLERITVSRDRGWLLVVSLLANTNILLACRAAWLMIIYIQGVPIDATGTL
jgi:hypothetical protein